MNVPHSIAIRGGVQLGGEHFRLRNGRLLLAQTREGRRAPFFLRSFVGAALRRPLGVYASTRCGTKLDLLQIRIALDEFFCAAAGEADA